MSQDLEHVADEPRDYTKYIWGGVGLLILAMVVFMLFSGESVPRQSEAKTRHILIMYNPSDPADRARALDLIQDLREQIVSGEASFEELAEEYSDDPQSGPRGGFVGAHRKGVMQEAYEEYAWSAPIGELSPVIQTGLGYHLIIVEDRYISDADKYDAELERRIREDDSTESPDNAAEAGSTEP